MFIQGCVIPKRASVEKRDCVASANNLVPFPRDALIDALKEFTKRYPEPLRDGQQSTK
jgi:hypothetical protein